MNTSGSSSLLRQALFPQGFAGAVMQLISKTWNDFTLSPKVNLAEPITALLGDRLKTEYTALGLPWFIVHEAPITNKITGKQESRTDLNFYHRDIPGQETVFTIECKRLHVSPPSGFKSLVADYFNEGLLRFVTERYSTDQPCGAMLGYVLDNDIDGAFNKIKKRVKLGGEDLHSKEGEEWLEPSKIMPYENHSADTHHERMTYGRIAIHHLLLGVIPQSNV